jgi:tetratricopeptide (TPR) repeat protein
MSAQVGSSIELLRSGEQALSQSNWQEASDQFKKAFDADSSQWRAVQGLSIALFWLGRREDAWVLAQESHRRAPHDEDNVANLRDIAQATGHEDELRQILATVEPDLVATESVQPSARRETPTETCALGERLLGSEKWNDSIPYFLKAIDEDAGESRAWGGIGIACYRQGWSNAARAFFEMAVRMNPSDEDAVFNWAESAPEGTSDRDLAMILDSMGVRRELREKAIEARPR